VKKLEGRELFKLQVYIVHTGVEFLSHKKHPLYFITNNSHSMLFKESFDVLGEHRQKSENLLHEQN
jgi:hypothetical protein